jgi:hypothetical protein
MTALGRDLLPLLIGERAKRLTLRALSKKLWSRVPTLRRYTPPKIVVALVVAIRRTAPILFVMIALFMQLLQNRGLTILVKLIGIAIVFLVLNATLHEWQGLPQSTLRRLPLLLPSGLVPCTRKGLGYALVAAEGVERVRARVWAMIAS